MDIFNRKRTFLAVAVSFILVILLVGMTVNPSQMRLADIEKASPNQTPEASERVVNFMLPITLPENQADSGASLIQVKRSNMQPVSKWFHVLLFVSVLLYGCTVSWAFLLNRPICIDMIDKPEMSLRIGGHAPPIYVCFS